MNVIVVTGVCQAGEELNLALPGFLRHPENHVLLWVDFKDPSDHARIAAIVPSDVRLYAAPPAMWGGMSIVLSMLTAIALCQRDISHWERLVFCSLRDVPLASCQRIVGELQRNWDFDYCGSRWNKFTSDVLRRELPYRPFDGADAHCVYDSHRVRPDMQLCVDTALSEMYPPQAVKSLRLCRDLRERYMVSAQEFPPTSTLTIERLSQWRWEQRFDFFGHFGLYAGRQWCVLSRKFCDLLLTSKVSRLAPMFQDLVIPDECFFQTIAAQYEQQGITTKWDSLYYRDAQVTYIDLRTLQYIVAGLPEHKLFGRKAAPTLTGEVLSGVLG